MVAATIGYGVLGIILMVLAFVIVDLAIPYHFIKEIFQEKNPAVGAVTAGLFIAIAIIIRSAII